MYLKYIFKKLMAITFFIKTIKKLGDIKSPKINAIFLIFLFTK